MRLGDRRDLITVEQRVEIGKSALNEIEYAWQQFAQGFAAIETRRGTEHFDSATKQRYSQTLYLFTCHFSDVAGVTTVMRVNFEGAIYDIKNIRPGFAGRDDTVIEATLQGG